MEPTLNQDPEQRARDQIDQMLRQAGWLVYDKNQGSPFDGKGVAMREYQTEVGPVDYALFVDGVPVGVIEAKREEEGHRMTAVEEQSRGMRKLSLPRTTPNRPGNRVPPLRLRSVGAGH